MTIKSIINNWYKELFWMGVGSVITLATQEVVRTIRWKKMQRAVDKGMQDMAHDISELRKQKEEPAAEMEVEEPQVETIEDLVASDSEEPIVAIHELKVISQEEFEDAKTGPDIFNRFELVYDPERNLFGYETGFEDGDLEDDVNICNLLKTAETKEGIIWELLHGRKDIYGSLSGGDVFVHIQLGSVEEVK